MRQVLNDPCIACFVLVIFFAIAGCNAKPEPGKSPVFDRGVTTSTSPVPTPTTVFTDWNATPVPGKAILRGRVIAQSNFLLGELYLGKAVPTSDPNVDLVELDEKTSPKAVLNRTTGEFIFLNVEPGKYGLIAWEPMSSILINDPQTRHTLFITLSADQVVDVGTILIP